VDGQWYLILEFLAQQAPWSRQRTLDNRREATRSYRVWAGAIVDSGPERVPHDGTL